MTFKQRIGRMLRPHTQLGRTTLWSGALSTLLLILRWITGAGIGTSLHAWGTFATLVFLVCGFLMLRRRFRLPVILWRLRNRLGVAYILIGVIPVMLLLLMAGIAGYMFAGQFATYVTLADLQSKLQHVQAANDSLAAQFSTLSRSGNLTAQTAAHTVADANSGFEQQTVTVWQDGKAFALAADGTPGNAEPLKIPGTIAGNFSGIVLDQDTLHLRAVKHADAGGHKLTVISDVPLSAQLLASAAARLGEVTVVPPFRSGELQIPPSPQPSLSMRPNIVASSMPAAARWSDRAFSFYTVFQVVNWTSGKSEDAAIGARTRPSLLYNVLFATLGDKAKIIRDVLLALALFFGLIELAALVMALVLSRSMTRSVAKLYDATEHVNRGDLTHRIDVRNRDQMATLERSFNSMTESLVALLAEQKEKQRLESELTIAREVQELLFPHTCTELPSLEVHGVCRPARSVSGDYYDFISLGTDRLALALGDISGKGISAALLMATVHAFVRAYSLEPDMVLPPELPISALSEGDPSMYYRTGGAMPQHLSPGMLMTTLNYQLFRCTPPEKYATLFLGCYNATRRELKYCNAGHLPPIVLRADGSLTRLTATGTVIGLFDGVTYGESTITMQPGDIFVAFSDGVTEPENESNEFGEQRLIELIRQHREQPLPYIAERITSAVEEWIGWAELPDDLTVILARAV
jgi:sigma-B regulation protein RsbU (phosphoserine phosphatase)